MAQDYWCGYWRHSPYGRAVHGAIYELENGIAFLEADPETSGARRDIRRLNAMLDSARWEWPTPCYYGRRPIRPLTARRTALAGRRPNIRCRVRSDQPLSRSR